MLKKSAIRRITTATLALIIVSILYFFPNKKDFYEVKTSLTYSTNNTKPLYLLNNDNYIVRASYISNSTALIDTIKEQISALTIDSEINENVPQSLKPVIPKNTKIKDLSIDQGLLKINFTKELLNVPTSDEENMIESIIYTLTENPEITKIMIFVEDNKLDYLPKSKIKLPLTLTRDYGINKIYDLTNLKDATKTTIYYIGKTNDLTYYVPVTKINNNNSNKVEIIIEELKSSPIYETNLLSYLASSVKLLNYEILEQEINLTFNNEILSDLNNEDILEEVKYSIALSLKDTLKVSQVNFLVEGKVVSTFKSENNTLN